MSIDISINYIYAGSDIIFYGNNGLAAICATILLDTRFPFRGLHSFLDKI